MSSAARTATDPLPYRAAGWFYGLVAFVVVLRELSELAGRALTHEGAGFALNTFVGFGASPGPLQTTWRQVVLRPESADVLADISVCYLLVDLAFVLFYLTGGWRLANHVRHPLRCFLKLGLILLALADGLEDILAGSVLVWGAPATTAASWATVVKSWILIVLMIMAGVAVVPRLRGFFGRKDGQFRRLCDLLHAYRMNILPVVLLAVLSVLSGTQVLDQLPDAQRAWVSDGPTGVRHALAGIAATVGLSVMLVLVGRAMCEPSNGAPEASQRPAVPWSAYIFPVAFVLCWFVYGALAAERILYPRILVWFVLLALLVAAAVRRRVSPGQPSQPDEPVEHTSVALGDIIGFSAMSIGGLSLLRSFAPLVALHQQVGLDWREWMAVVVLLLVGLAGVILPWWICCRRIEGHHSLIELPRSTEQRHRVLTTMIIVTAIVLVIMAVMPMATGRFAGVAAAATVTIGGLALMITMAGLVLRRHRVPAAFEYLGLRSVPVVWLLIVIMIAVSQVPYAGTLHNIRSESGPMPNLLTRPTLRKAFETWQDGPACEIIDPSSSIRIRPMMMVASEGGGIRAAYWSVLAMDRIAGRATCSAHNTLFSSGASGGSVGLTVSRFSAEPLSAIDEMAGPEALSAAVIGTFLRDPAYGLTGIPVPAFDTGPGWLDRARLMEDRWSSGPAGRTWGSRDFLLPAGDLQPVTGALILNTASMANNCRGWLSQVQLSAGTPTVAVRPERTCDASSGVGPQTLDVLESYARRDRKNTDERACLGGVRAATAALLTARFPYVTPSALVGPCPRPEGESQRLMAHWPETQLIDGGYLENSGIATITDLASQWLPMVQEHNADTARSGAGTLIVPVVVYLTNDTQGVIGPGGHGVSNELLVPPLGALNGFGALNQAAPLLRRAQTLVEPAAVCGPDVPEQKIDCPQLVATMTPFRTIVVDRSVRPEISAPLGWVLSKASVDALTDTLDQQANTKMSCTNQKNDDQPNDPDCDQGYGRLADLLELLNDKP